MLPEWPALVAIVIWASLATVSGGVLDAVRPAPLIAVALGSAGVAFAGMALFRSVSWRSLVPRDGRRFALGAYGLGGYHVALFTGFSMAPLVEANLLNYLWPVLTVLLAAPMAGEKLRAHAIVASVAGFAGMALVVGGGGARFESSAFAGYALTVGAALIWSSFTNLLKRHPLGAEDLAPGCLATGVAAAIVTVIRGDPWPSGPGLGAAIYLGAMPIALATLFWEAGVRRGRVAIVGSLSYLAPLLSTLGVWFFLDRPVTGSALGGGVLILGSAILGSRR